MAKRPIFLPNLDGDVLVSEIEVEFKYHSGFSVHRKRESIASLHEAARRRGISPILEISTKSNFELGVYLSAFNLNLTVRGGVKASVEGAYQGSKVFEHGGPFRELFSKAGKEIKSDKRLIESGNLVAFEFEDRTWSLEPKTAFYDWLYVTALIQNPEVSAQLPMYQAFSDIEFNPRRSINCQARAAALFVALTKRDMLTTISDPVSFSALQVQ